MAKYKRVYDLYFSIGEACSSSATLRASGLQYFSYPFDWLAYGTPSNKAKFICNDFKGFMDIEDLEYMSYRKSPNPIDIYKNKVNNIEYHHDFPLGIPLKDSYDSVKEKYDRRAARLISDIEKSSKVLAVYLFKPFNLDKNIKDEEFIFFQKELAKRFSNTQVDVLCFRNDPKIKENEVIEKDLSENVKLVKLNYGNEEKDKSYDAVDGKILKQYFKKYKLILPLSSKLRLLSFAALRTEKLKKGIGLYFLPKIKNNILRIRFLLFGLRIDLCIGKVKE